MLDDSLVDFWGLGYISQDRCSMSCCIVARNDGDCDTPVHKTCLEIVFFLTLHPSRILEVWITNMEYSPGFNNASSEEYQTLAQVFVDEVSGEGCDLLPVSIKPSVLSFFPPKPV